MIMTPRSMRPASLLLIAAGFVLWASAFSMLYAAQAVGCAVGANVWTHRGAMLLIWAVHLLLLVALLVYCRRLPNSSNDGIDDFVRTVAIGSTAAALAATVLTGLVVPVVTPCL
jgi:hypothetical protein